MDNNTNNSQTNVSFLDDKQSVSFHIKDLVFLLLRNIHWLIIFALLGGVIANLYTRRQEKIYESNAKILIRSGNDVGVADNNMREMSIRTTLGLQSFYSSTLYNEMMILTSKTTIRKAVEDLHLNIVYSTHTRFTHRDKDLYGISPVEIEMADDDFPLPNRLVITILDEGHALLSRSGHPSLYVPFDKVVITPMGRMTVRKTWAFENNYIGQEITVENRDLTSVAEYYRWRLDVQRDSEKNTILNLSMHDSSPQRCADFINTVIRVYNDGAVNDKKRIISDTYNYINERINIISGDLDAQESAMANYRSSNDVVTSSTVSERYISESINSNNQIFRLQSELAMVRSLLDAIRLSDGSSVIPVGSVSNPVIVSYLTTYNQQAQEVARYIELGTTKNPVALRTIEKQRQLQQDLASITEGYIASLEQRILSERSVGNSATAKMRSAPQKQIYLEGMERNQKIKEQLYISLLSRREELMISQPSLEGVAKIIDEARVNKRPIAPNTTRMTVIGLIIGLMIPILFYILRRLFDTQVKTYNDIEAATTIPFLSEIPALPPDDSRSIVINDKEHDGIAESFRHLRAKIEFLGGKEGKSKVLLFTSLVPGSGKTFTTSNLAASIGLTDKKIIIVDLDLRKGSLTRKFYNRHKPGIVNYLTEKEDNIDSLIQHDIVAPNVDALFSGPLPPNPAELLGSPRFDQVIDYLRTKYEYIILDSTPAGMVVDTDIVKHVADHTCFLIRARRFDKRMLLDVERLYKEHAFPSMCTILNDVKYDKQPLYGRQYGYGYGYGYGYSYGDDPKGQAAPNKKSTSHVKDLFRKKKK